MDDKKMQNYEEAPSKENVFVKALKMFLTYLKNLVMDFIRGFKYNNMKLPAILVALPGVLLGFFITFHAPTINELTYDYIQDTATEGYAYNAAGAVDSEGGNLATLAGKVSINGKVLEASFTYDKELSAGKTYQGDNADKAGIYSMTSVSGDYSKDNFEKFILEVDGLGAGEENPGSATFVYKLKEESMDGRITSRFVFKDNTYSITFSETKSLLPFDYSGMVLFVLMLFGILNIFTAVSMSGKKNLGSVVTATITTSIIVICGVLYFVAIFICYNGIQDGTLINRVWNWDLNKIVSMLSIILSMVSSVAGVILGYIFYDRTYEKVDR